jgi:cytoskeletal protein CcmA (bactofilin family)
MMEDERIVPKGMDPDECLPEWIYSIYVDRELEPIEMRAVDAHLVRCRACRERVMALDDEAIALRLALREGEIAEPVARTVPPARGFVMGIGPAAAAVFLVLTVAGWLIETRIPSPIEWLNPFVLTGAFSMFFDTVFMVRDEAPALYQLVVSSAALLSVAFLLTTAFTSISRRLLGPGKTALLAGLAVSSFHLASPPPASAVEFRIGDDTKEEVVPVGEVADQTWVTSAREVRIEGTLHGDLFVFAERVLISGELDGDLIAVARKVEVSGRVSGSVITLAERVQISGDVVGNVYSAAEQTEVAESGRVLRDLVAGGDGVELSGVVGRDAMTFGSWLEARGEIGRDLEARAERLEIMRSARIGRDLRARYFENEDDVVIDEGAAIGGEVTTEQVTMNHPSFRDRYSTRHFYVFTAVSIAAALLAGMVMFRFAPWLFRAGLGTAGEFFRAMAYGFVALVAVPIGLVILACTIIGIPLALIGLFAFGTCAYLAKIVVGAILGMAICGEPEASDWSGFGLPLIVGLGIVMVTMAIPYVGGVVGFVTLLVGLGVIADRLWERYRV